MADYKKGLLSSRSCSWYIWMNVYQDVHICMLTIIMCFFQGLGLRALISLFHYSDWKEQFAICKQNKQTKN